MTQHSALAHEGGSQTGSTQHSIYVRRIQTLAEYQACQDIHRQVWGFGPQDTVMHLPLMVALQEYGGLVLGAFERQNDGAEQQIGFALGFTGHDQPTGQYFHYSQIAAALSEWQNRGVGLALKMAQRREVLAQGYHLMRWAFDPLEARNAYFNLAKLGAVSRRYYTNMYGPGRGELFGQLDTDRLILDWELDSQHVQTRLNRAASNQKPTHPIADYQTIPALVEVEWLAENVPNVTTIDLHRTETRLKLEIPAHNRTVQKFSFQVSENWRNQTRALFQHYLTAGYYIADFFSLPAANQSNQQTFYLLQKDDAAHV
jgi:predicted GNAT superfamily acetyltransferase